MGVIVEKRTATTIARSIGFKTAKEFFAYINEGKENVDRWIKQGSTRVEHFIKSVKYDKLVTGEMIVVKRESVNDVLDELSNLRDMVEELKKGAFSELG